MISLLYLTSQGKHIGLVPLSLNCVLQASLRNVTVMIYPS